MPPVLTSYLFFDGTCAEAMRFYERSLGGVLSPMRTYASAPVAQTQPSGMADRIMHAHLELNGQVIMASDSMIGEPYAGMHGFNLHLGYPTASEAERIFAVLAAGGQVRMRIQKTFWAEAFGMLVDRFGTPWMVSGDQPG